MAVTVVSQAVNARIPKKLTAGGISILSGVLECVFKGNETGEVTHDTLRFRVGRVNLTGLDPIASCVVSPASIAYDGPVSNALWAVDGARVAGLVNLDRGSGTADLEVEADLAVRGLNGVLLRLNYIVFESPI